MTTILVIEDDLALCSNVVDLLEAEGYTALSAENGMVGVQVARAHLPDVIICDVMMPGLDGYGVLEELSRDPLMAAIPFIFLTAKAEKTDLRKGMNLGADDYIVKPFGHADLIGAISTRLAKRAQVTMQFERRLDGLRQSLARSVPHEMRTALSGIFSGVGLLKEEFDTLSRADSHVLLEIINSSSERLNHLVVNYLGYAEIEIVALQPEMLVRWQSQRSPSADGVVRSVATYKAAKFNRSADLDLEATPATAQVAESHLEKIASELIDNAFKFSKPGTRVHVASRLEGPLFILSVTDHGYGMTAQQIAEVGAYMQFDRKLREQQGSGLGLTIARRLAELHKGGMAIESMPGVGTTVRVTLPA
jgi:signal transduction histidine kinase